MRIRSLLLGAAATLVDPAPAPDVMPSEQGGPDLSVGTVVGEYQIERKIGAGR